MIGATNNNHSRPILSIFWSIKFPLPSLTWVANNALTALHHHSPSYQTSTTSSEQWADPIIFWGGRRLETRCTWYHPSPEDRSCCSLWSSSGVSWRLPSLSCLGWIVSLQVNVETIKEIRTSFLSPCGEFVMLLTGWACWFVWEKEAADTECWGG